MHIDKLVLLAKTLSHNEAGKKLASLLLDMFNTYVKYRIEHPEEYKNAKTTAEHNDNSNITDDNVDFETQMEEMLKSPDYEH